MATATVKMESPERVVALIRPDVERSMETKVRRVQSAARRLAPKRTGRLRASIRMDRRDAAGRYSAGGRRTIALYEVSANTPSAGYVHNGTRPHIIRVRNAKVLTDGVNFFGTMVRHPGTRPQPFLTQALREVGL